jgi:hypothetical protein
MPGGLSIEGLFGELKNRPGGFAYYFWTYSLEKRKKDALPVLPKDKKILKDVEMTKKSIETYVFCHCLVYGILTGLRIMQSQGIRGKFTGWLRVVRTEYPTIWVTRQVVSDDFHRYAPKLKRLRVFGHIIESMRTDAFLYKICLKTCDSQDLYKGHLWKFFKNTRNYAISEA